MDLLGTDVGWFACVDGLGVGRGDIELVVGCIDVNMEVGLAVTSEGGVGRFVDGIDVGGGPLCS